ncbi:MAG: T9SS type A sorting domain-containing protein, partial [Bacteroidales bacterium]|jgi:hypothetical protein|nr:T9SS type A sorting domain-containing protein [Bacteroidales bacterium]
MPLTTSLITATSYIDENLPNGKYNYYIITYYTNDCISDSSNHVEQTIALSIKEMNNEIAIYPNPTKNEFKVSGFGFKVSSIEIFDLMGRTVEAHQFPSFGGAGVVNNGRPETTINISHLPPGMYFIRITTENGVITRKITRKIIKK